MKLALACHPRLVIGGVVKEGSRACIPGGAGLNLHCWSLGLKPPQLVPPFGFPLVPLWPPSDFSWRFSLASLWFSLLLSTLLLGACSVCASRWMAHNNLLIKGYTLAKTCGYKSFVCEKNAPRVLHVCRCHNYCRSLGLADC